MTWPLLTAVLVSTIAGVGLTAAPAAAADQSTMKAAATAFGKAMARRDVASARRLVRATTRTQASAVLRWSTAWRGVSGATCRGVVCQPTGWRMNDPIGLLMRKANGRWWVAGLITYHRGPGRLIGSKAIYDPATGRPALAGAPQGTTYWRLIERDPQDDAFLKVVRSGASLSLYARMPGVYRQHAPVLACTWGRVDAAANFTGRTFTDTLPPFGSPDVSSLSRPIWTTGRVLSANGMVDFYGYGTTLVGGDWTRSTYSSTGGSAWTEVTAACAAARSGA